ncbi:hypothetical protein EUGRSUZ_A00835 [Eucalyptus grandis]|uniref:Uncharacterized protein n=2 Tax=Eucalyptus grandis TaxID=71139 RepID=A0ACC3M050_EUCGR|nr:hypothetical protein EUGRSUZ_A00835 [Eucalyptus grandis]
MQKQTKTFVCLMIKQKTGNEFTSIESERKLNPMSLFVMKLIGATPDVNVVWQAMSVRGIHVHASTDAFWKIPCSAKEKILKVVSIQLQLCSLVSKPSIKLCCEKQSK